ncbi:MULTISPECIES: restriction endonuclease subunit S [Escherichia]|uniref:restriction endonuclease subunit S n=1 Tax=Escherichia TaxID=561 RepID=UPI000D3B98B8|nr:restriction endonuclease subunit S [Escherichia coli]EEK4152460.1 restriction endonuclease subunit S [Salmonella enterica]EFN8538083.1 restriction endonuclease subunit S [Escherichia coli O1]EFB5280542.1 restriction endonuclease subunit S [Escherichia coli]EFN9794559.1 restriction endonuclease subunit S [Escherichia coli]EFT2881430.1 restriction endonuclease subunit S [Escherichia coli]
MESITSTLKYDQYSDSGYEWIGEIPEHWDLVKLGSCLSPVSVKNCPELPLLSITREQGVIERDVDNQESNHNFIPDDLSGYKKLEKGQFGMNKMKAWQGSYGVSKFTGIVSPAYFIFDFTKAINPEFFNWAIRSKLYVSFFGSASDGVRIGQWDLSKARMKVIPFVLPSEEEQSLIANFLDKKTALIDEAISIKEQQISLLKERKQIIIQQAVTQGLDPNVPMKDSGVDWIGKVPAHWEVKKMKFIFDSIQTGTTPVTSEPKYFDGDVDWYNPKDLNAGYLDKSEKTISELAIKHGQAKIFPGDSVLIVGIGATCGKTAYLKSSSAFNQQITGFSSRHENAEFMYYLISMYSSVMLKVANYTTLPILNNEFFKHFLLPCPSKIEQDRIVGFLRIETLKFEKTIEIQLQQIERLKEYKTTLINSAVTGKIKITPEMVEQ